MTNTALETLVQAFETESFDVFAPLLVRELVRINTYELDGKREALKLVKVLRAS